MAIAVDGGGDLADRRHAGAQDFSSTLLLDACSAAVVYQSYSANIVQAGVFRPASNVRSASRHALSSEAAGAPSKRLPMLERCATMTRRCIRALVDRTGRPVADFSRKTSLLSERIGI